MIKASARWPFLFEHIYLDTLNEPINDAADTHPSNQPEVNHHADTASSGIFSILSNTLAA